jgi:hypothetical protein
MLMMMAIQSAFQPDGEQVAFPTLKISSLIIRIVVPRNLQDKPRRLHYTKTTLSCESGMDLVARDQTISLNP